jgi:hypothetical protein
MPRWGETYSSILSLTLALNGGGWLTSRSDGFDLREKGPISIVQKSGWVQGPIGKGVENFAPTGIRSPYRPARTASRICRRGYSPESDQAWPERVRTNVNNVVLYSVLCCVLCCTDCNKFCHLYFTLMSSETINLYVAILPLCMYYVDMLVWPSRDCQTEKSLYWFLVYDIWCQRWQLGMSVCFFRY